MSQSLAKLYIRLFGLKAHHKPARGKVLKGRHPGDKRNK
jgi:hypothetical protein